MISLLGKYLYRIFFSLLNNSVSQREGDDRGWDGWMASPTQWTWVWVNFRSWWWTGRPGMLRSMGSQRVDHDWATELNWTEAVLTLLIFTKCVWKSSVMELLCLLLGFEWSEFRQVLIFAHGVWERLDGRLQNWRCQQLHYVFFKKFLPKYAQSSAPGKQCLSPT